MNAKSLNIKNRKGDILSATIEFPLTQKASHIAIFAHCFTCTSKLNAARNINRALTQNGIAVVRFDFTGLGKSTGDFSDSHFEANIDDIQDVHQYITKEYFTPELLIGHSLGGTAALVAASIIEDIKAVCTIGSPADIEHTTKHFKDQLPALKSGEKAIVQIGGRNFSINKSFVDGFKRHDLPNIIKSLRKPLLILHSPIDEIVAVKNAQDIYLNAMHPKSFVSLDQADHLLTNKNDSIYAGNVIATWVVKYLPRKMRKRIKPDTHQIVAYLNSEEDKFTTTVNSNNHGLIADEPKEIGGEDYGMAPYDLVTAGLSACTAMTVNLYAKRKEWPLENIKVYISHSKEKNEEGKYYDLFKKEIALCGPLNEKQRKRIIEIAAKCPVHKTLISGAKIETVLKISKV